MAAKGKNSGKDKESEVWSAISAFEQILEAMPNDRTSIETLAHAYEQIGDLTRAKDYLIRLVDVILAESDRDAAQNVLETVKAYAADDPVARRAAERLETFLVGARQARDTREEDQKTRSAQQQSAEAKNATTTFNIAKELSFAWKLLEAKELTQEEYSSVVQDLTDMSGTDSAVTVSVLHVLNDRGFKNLNKIMGTVSKDCGTPIISLSSFELQPNAFSLLPKDFMLQRGVIIFDLLGRDTLAVIMNPYDKQLMKDVETLTKKKCHFFITPPSEFDAALSKISNRSEQPSEEA